MLLKLSISSSAEVYLVVLLLHLLMWNLLLSPVENFLDNSLTLKKYPWKGEVEDHIFLKEAGDSLMGPLFSC